MDSKKLSKLVKTAARKRILLLERQHMNLLPESIHEEIKNRRTMFPALAHVHEIWIVENIPFFQEKHGYVRFELRAGGELVRTFDFQHGKLFTRSEPGMAVPTKYQFERFHIQDARSNRKQLLTASESFLAMLRIER